MKNTFYYMTQALAFFAATGVTAAGFGLNEMSARGNAMQGTLIGSTKDASAAFYNPANLTELDSGMELMVGITLARPDYHTRVDGKTTDQDETIFPLPHFYLGGKLRDNLYCGFGEYTEYGLGTSYEGHKTWPLSANSIETKMTSFTLSPSLAWQVTDRLSVGGGFRAVYLNLVNDVMVPAFGSKVHMDVDDFGYGYLLSAAYQLTKDLRVGVVYRSEVDFHEEGDVEIMPLGLKCGVNGDITLPKSVMIGLNWQTTERLELALNATWNEWSVIESLDQHFDHPALPDSIHPQHWNDTWRFSVGAEYVLNENWAFQCGYTFDVDPSNAGYAGTMVPPGDRNQIGFGFTYGKDDWKIGIDYMLVIIRETDRIIDSKEAEFRDLRTDTLGFSYSKNF